MICFLLSISGLLTIAHSSSMDSTYFNQTFGNCSSESSLENVLFAAFYLVIFLLALVGNGLALWVFSGQRGPSSPANIFLVHLAVADLSYVAILPLRAVYHLLGGHWPFGEIPCRISGFLFYVNMYASLYFLACVAGDRYLAVVHAVRSLKIRRSRYAHFVSAGLWILVTVSMAPLLVSGQTAQVDNITVCLQLYREKASKSALISLALAFTPPFLVTLTSYLLIAQSLRQGVRLEPGLKSKALRTISLVLLIYLVCFLPYHISRATFILTHGEPTAPCPLRRTLLLGNRVTSFLTCLNGTLDPLVYIFGAEKFRDGLQRLLCRGKAEPSVVTSGEGKVTHESSISAKSEL
ncbi:uracil nucleotide/cysteinyl leukotriene receptor [Erpetoichthys calabaricus]|uniref:uracil nucleotide/cysteinyl leukotriene receptor n=1 Tax=Erpetoichthys calabaricus TaxID=27687 RepID=UPI00223457FA|nr:uracil nucleotide/cysteinyl leukotriene receptor [Erpetoichthys calabaricus]